MADSSRDRPADSPARLTEPATEADLRRWSTLTSPRGEELDHTLVRRFSLLVTEGPDVGQRFVSTGERVVVGTHGACDVVLHDTTASSFHCEIAPRGKAVVLRDLESATGTIVDGVSVVEAYLKSGAVLALGRSRVRFDAGGEPVRVPVSARDRFGLLVGSSAAMRRVYGQLERAAAGDGALLIEGEAGAGKMAAALSVHLEGPRRDGPFVAVDCAGAAPEQLEPELFDDGSGALTAARGGTLLLDEVGELSSELQLRLLRALHELTVDVRVIAATSRDLRTDVNARRLNPDLYHRLAVFECRLPALRERPEDLPLLVEAVLGSLGASQRPEAELLRTRDFYAELARHAWPENVRQLAATIERCLGGGEGSPAAADRPLRAVREGWNRTFEQRYLDGLLRMHGGNVATAARAAGVDRFRLHNLLWKHGLK
jgi:transcriptional regulator with AAA-type ATPase domain